MINKLATMNPDFQDFLNQVRFGIMSRDRVKERYDKILTKEELIRLVKK